VLASTSAGVGVGVDLVSGGGLVDGVREGRGGFDFIAIRCFRVRVVFTWNFDFVLFSLFAILSGGGGRWGGGRWGSRRTLNH
jgi:hypothetical protein